MGIRDERNSFVFQHHFVRELWMRILGQLAGSDDAVTEEIVLFANPEYVTDPVRVTAMDTAKNAIAAQERLAGLVESNQARHLRRCSSLLRHAAPTSRREWYLVAVIIDRRAVIIDRR
jgi:hypothetical protein